MATPDPTTQNITTRCSQLGASAMCAPLDGFWLRVRRVARPGIWLAVACRGAGCEEMVTRQYSRDVGELSRADRINVAFVYRPDPVSGAPQLPPTVTITDRHRVAAAAAFVSRYRDGWRNILGGSPWDAEAAFYQGERLLGKIGLFSLGITHEGYARSLTPAEVAELVDLLGISSQFLESPQGRPRGDPAPSPPPGMR